MLSAPVLEPPIARELRSDYVTTGGYINFNDPALAVSRYEWEYSGQRLVYQFDQNTSVTRDDVILTRLNNGAQLPASDLIDSTSGYSETQVFDFPINPTFGYRTLPNGNYEAILRANGPSNNDGQKLATENVTGFFVLMGDINHDRVVNGDDYGIIDFNSMFEESRSYVAGDLNYSNEEVGYAINADDYALIDSAGTYGTSMPKAPSAANTLIAYASLGRGRIDLNWTAPTDMSNVNGFRIFRSTDGGASYVAYATVAADKRNWFETGLPDGKKYNYRVRPYSTANGNGPTTNAAWAVTNLPGPGELSATAASGNGVNLNFTDNTNDESGFEVWQSTAGGAFVLVDILPANTEQGPMVYRVSGLTPATSYSFRVRAKSAAQSSIFTLRETVMTAGVTIPIVNAGFEQPVLGTGEQSSTVPGWTISGDFEYPDASAGIVRTSAAQFPGSAPQGSNALVIKAGPFYDPYWKFTQELPEQVLTANTLYTITYKLRNISNTALDTYGVNLLAGATSLPSDDMPPDSPSEFVTASATFDSRDAEASLLGQPLSVQIFYSFLSDQGNRIGEFAVDDITITAAPMAEQSPRGGTPWLVPGVIEFEDFDDGGQNVSWLDTTEGNIGGEYRRDTDADVDVARDDTGSFIVGWAKPTEWLEYTIDVVNAGSYDLTSYVSAPVTGGAFHWELDGNAIVGAGETLAVPDTDGYFDYRAVTLSNVTFSQGQHVLRLKLDTAGNDGVGWNSVANFNYFTLNQTNGNLSEPMGLTATAPYSNRVDLSWTNDDTNAVSFNVQRSSDEDNPTWTTVKIGLRAGTTFYADTAAVGGLYRVIAVGAGGDTLASQSVSVNVPDATDRPTETQPWLINFQVDRTIPVPGYLIDSGDIFGVRDNGLAYGWNIDHTIQDRERGINADRRRDTLVHFRQGGEWSIAIPDGTYDVTVSIGDPGWASTYTLNVNGLSYWSNLALAKNTFQQKTMTANVTDGKIVLDAGTSPDRSTKINYIEITPSGDPPPPEGTPVVKIEAKNAQGVIDNTAFEEGQDPAWFTVSRTGDTTDDLTITYTVGGNASPGDYSPVLTNSVTIPADSLSDSFSITPDDDDLAEGAQTVTLSLASDTAYVLGTPANATATIFDNDSTSSVSFTSPNPNEIDVSWDAVVGAAYYEVFQTNSPAAELDVPIAQPGTNFYEDWDGLQASTTYFYTIVAVLENQSETIGTIAATTIADLNLPAAGSEQEEPAASSPTSGAPPTVVRVGLRAEGVNDSEILLTWSAPKTSYGDGGLVWIDMSSNGGGAWTVIDPSADWGAYKQYTFNKVPIQSQAFLVRNLDRSVNYQFRVHYSTNDRIGGFKNLWTTAPVTAQVRVPEFNNVILLVAGHQQTIGRLLSTSEQPNGKLLSVAAIWRQLVDDGFNAYLSPEPEWQGSVLNANGTGFGYSAIQREVDRGMTNIAFIGYSHGGGTIYTLANLVESSGVLPPWKDGIIFSGTIDAVERTADDNSLESMQSLMSAPGGSNARSINFWQPYPYPLFPGFLRGSDIADADQNNLLERVTFTDITGAKRTVRASHVNIYFDDKVVADMTDAVEDQLRSQIDF